MAALFFPQPSLHVSKMFRAVAVIKGTELCFYEKGVSFKKGWEHII